MKNIFYIHENTPLAVAIRLRRLTGIKQGNFPFTYLGCPIYYGKGKICCFENMVRKISREFLPRKTSYYLVGEDMC